MIVAVAFPITIDGVYDYAVPPTFEGAIRRGMPVKVSLRNRELWGVVVAIKQKSQYPNLKEVLEVKGEGWSKSSESLMTLYQWISDYYHAPLGKVFKPIIKKSMADKKAKEVAYFSITSYIPVTLTAKQQVVVEGLPKTEDAFTSDQLKRQFGLSQYMIGALEKLGVLKRNVTTVLRESSEAGYTVVQGDGNLSEEQQTAVDTIWKYKGSPDKPFLLHGVTGSGKTHVYTSVAHKVLAEGRGVIILVPEISLTPQTIGRISAELGQDVAVMHSRMSDGERRDSIEQIVSGKRKVVIGVRSAILVPMQNPGLIVVDEEHDGSYKQSDPEPRYHARDVAIMRGRFQQALVVLGSATPSVESYYNATVDKYHLIELKERFGAGELPKVEIVNMHAERALGSYTPLSKKLEVALQETVKEGKQAVLLLNRRGYSVTLKCESCEEVRQCPHCSVNLVYHRNGDKVICHHCGYVESPDYSCGSCGGKEVQFTGTGIQKVEAYLSERFPSFRILRMDQDTTSKKGGHLQIIRAFEDHSADILLGTQMVAKGLNFPKVNLVGVLQADIGMSIPDFRAGERLFQLLTQVSGRAGRVDAAGRVFIQTFNPTDLSVVSAQKHDYNQYYTGVIHEREEVGYPPFRRLARIMFQDKNQQLVQSYAQSVASYVRKRYPHLQILGPVEALFARLKGEFRYALLIKSVGHSEIQEALAHFKVQVNQHPTTVKIKIDVDPVQMG